MVKAPVESGQICGSQAFLTFAVHNVDVVVGRRNAVGNLSSTVRRIIIGDQNVDVWVGAAGPRNDGLDILDLIVGRNDDKDLVEPDFSVGGGHSSPICCDSLVRA